MSNISLYCYLQSNQQDNKYECSGSPPEAYRACRIGQASESSQTLYTRYDTPGDIFYNRDSLSACVNGFNNKTSDRAFV